MEIEQWTFFWIPEATLTSSHLVDNSCPLRNLGQFRKFGSCLKTAVVKLIHRRQVFYGQCVDNSSTSGKRLSGDVTSQTEIGSLFSDISKRLVYCQDAGVADWYAID